MLCFTCYGVQQIDGKTNEYTVHGTTSDPSKTLPTVRFPRLQGDEPPREHSLKVHAAFSRVLRRATEEVEDIEAVKVALMQMDPDPQESDEEEEAEEDTYFARCLTEGNVDDVLRSLRSIAAY